MKRKVIFLFSVPEVVRGETDARTCFNYFLLHFTWIGGRFRSLTQYFCVSVLTKCDNQVT